MIRTTVGIVCYGSKRSESNYCPKLSTNLNELKTFSSYLDKKARVPHQCIFQVGKIELRVPTKTLLMWDREERAELSGCLFLSASSNYLHSGQSFQMCWFICHFLLVGGKTRLLFMAYIWVILGYSNVQMQSFYTTCVNVVRPWYIHIFKYPMTVTHPTVWIPLL